MSSKFCQPCHEYVLDTGQTPKWCHELGCANYTGPAAQKRQQKRQRLKGIVGH